MIHLLTTRSEKGDVDGANLTGLRTKILPQLKKWLETTIGKGGLMQVMDEYNKESNKLTEDLDRFNKEVAVLLPGALASQIVSLSAHSYATGSGGLARAGLFRLPRRRAEPSAERTVIISGSRAAAPGRAARECVTG